MTNVAALPRVPAEARTVGRTFTGRAGQVYRPSMFVTLTLPSYGRVTPGTGTPADPGSYDYRRAALDAIHLPRLLARWVQNLRRCAGYRAQYFASVEPQKRLAPVVAAHLGTFVGPGPTDLVFTGAKGAALRRGNFQKHWAAAVASADLPRAHFHDLRHTGNTLTAHSGATLSDLMARMGHSSTRAARIYLHTSSDQDVAVAPALDALIHKRPTGT